MVSSFFTKTTAANLWKGVTGVSAAGAKRGRGKGTGRAIARDLNRGQEIGKGRVKLVMPGLNERPNKPLNVEVLGKDEKFQERITKLRAEASAYIKKRDAPLDRGWSGRRTHGRKAGSPDDFNETSFENFQSTVLMMRPLLSMTGNLGRTRRMHALVVAGNGNGLAGFSTAIGNDARTVVRHARNRAGQALVAIPRWENHTVMHDFFSRYYFTTVFVERKPRGYGVRAHRVIQSICEAFGITDLFAKVEGSSDNQINITKAFFLGLMNQRRYEDMAEEKRLHLVELREENYHYPFVLASPKSQIRSDEEIRNSTENLDFTYYINDGRIKQVKPKKRNPYESYDTWNVHLDRLDFEKNREQTKLFLAAKYGDTKVRDVFPYFKTTADSFNKAE